MVNDYFDYVAGVDGEAQGDRPLVKGDITPFEAKRALKWFYFVIILAICVVESRALRIYVLFNALLTYVYTQELKPRGFLYKNGCVAIVISLAIGLGAAAAQADASMALAAGIVQVWPAMLATFCGIFAREVIMDVTDVEGDSAAGIQTLPVAVGRGRALGACQALLAPVCALQLLVPLSRGWRLAAPATGLLLALGSGGMLALVRRAAQSEGQESAERAVALCPLPLAVVLAHLLAA